MQDTIWKQIKCLLLKCYNFMLPSPYPQSHCVHVQYQSLLNSGPLHCFVILWSHRFYNLFRPCETVHIKQLLYCSSNVDLGQGRRQDFLWERGVTLFEVKKRAGKRNSMQAHSTVVVVRETVLSICPRAVLRRRFFDPLQWLKALKRLNVGVWGRVWRKGSRRLF